MRNSQMQGKFVLLRKFFNSMVTLWSTAVSLFVCYFISLSPTAAAVTSGRKARCALSIVIMVLQRWQRRPLFVVPYAQLARGLHIPLDMKEDSGTYRSTAHKQGFNIIYSQRPLPAVRQHERVPHQASGTWVSYRGSERKWRVVVV